MSLALTRSNTARNPLWECDKIPEYIPSNRRGANAPRPVIFANSPAGSSKQLRGWKRTFERRCHTLTSELMLFAQELDHAILIGLDKP